MMKKKVLIVLLVSAVLIPLLAYLIFQPAYIHFDMPCMEMTADGEPLETGQLLLTGLQYRQFAHGREFTKFIPFELQIPHYQGFTPEYPRHRTVATSLYPGCLIGFFFVRNNGGIPDITSCDIVWHADGSCCTVYVDGRFFVGSHTGDYEAALALFHSVLHVGELPD